MEKIFKKIISILLKNIILFISLIVFLVIWFIYIILKYNNTNTVSKITNQKMIDLEQKVAP